MKDKVGERIRLARLAKNLSQQNMADEVGLTVAAYSNIERGITDISITRLIQIATILNVNAISFMNNDNEYFNEIIPPLENNQSSLTQQVFMLIQQNQQLNTRIEILEREISSLKK